MSDWHRHAPCRILSMRPFYFLMSKLVHPHVLRSRDHLLTLMHLPCLLASRHPRSVRPLKGSGQGCPLLRASSNHCFIVGALRARRAPGRSHPFQARSLSLQGWGLIDLPLRASNEGLLRPRVARAQKIIRLHPLLFIVRVLRARRMAWLELKTVCEQAAHQGFFH